MRSAVTQLAAENQIVVAERPKRRYAHSFNEGDQREEKIQPEPFCLNAALAYVYLSQAAGITQDQVLQHPRLSDMRGYLITQCEHYLSLMSASVSETIKSSFASLIYSLKFDPANIDQEELRNLQSWSMSHAQLVNDQHRTVLLSRTSAISKRLQKHLLAIAQESYTGVKDAAKQPLTQKSYDFSRALCHFNRCSSKEYGNEQEFFNMIKEVNLDDIRN